VEGGQQAQVAGQALGQQRQEPPAALLLQEQPQGSQGLEEAALHIQHLGPHAITLIARTRIARHVPNTL